MDDFDKFVESLGKLKTLNGQTIPISSNLGSASEEMELPLKKRLRDTDEEAIDRREMISATRGQPFDIKKINEIVNQYIKEKIFKGTL